VKEPLACPNATHLLPLSLYYQFNTIKMKLAVIAALVS
jgi:hypothetical protein